MGPDPMINILLMPGLSILPPSNNALSLLHNRLPHTLGYANNLSFYFISSRARRQRVFKRTSAEKRKSALTVFLLSNFKRLMFSFCIREGQDGKRLPLTARRGNG
jgi:hypothetical protein